MLCSRRRCIQCLAVAKRLFYLARHGETDWNAQGRWQGQTDVPLNPKGRAQALGLGEALRSAGIVAIVSSDLSRASETARVVAAQIQLDVDYLDPGLRERSLGIFDGLTREECASLHPEAWQQWVDQRRPPAGAEADADLAVRVTAAMERAVGRIPGEGGPFLIVTHGGAIRASVTAATGQTPPPIPNCGVWAVEWEGGIRRAFASPLPVRPRTC
jgi:broad specificity phosphatase PhoE